MYTLYKFHFLNGISEINQLFDDILIIWPAPVSAHVLGQLPAESEVLQVLWRNKREQQQKWQIMEINVMLQAVQGMWSAGLGLVSVFRKARKANNVF